MFYGILLILVATSFVLFGIELNQLIEDTTPIVAIVDSVYIDDLSIGMETDSEGSSFEGSIAFFESNIPYDTIYDDDTTGDGYRDRRSYYLGNDMVFASWDENADWNYETSMRIVDGMYVDSQISDMNNDGIIDTITTFSNDGEEVFTESDLLNVEDAELRENPYARELSAETVFWVVLPLILGLVFLGILIISLAKNKKASRITSLLLCLTMIVVPLADPAYASDLYNDDGTVDQEVFEKDWEKYSDIDDRIPLEQRSYEAMEYGKAEQEIRKLYSLMYQTATNQELNRLNYVDLADYKKAVVTTHKKNLIKSTIRLAAFTGYTVNDSIGKGKTFAENILKSGATLVTQLGDVLTVTSDFVTDSYKESFGMLQKAYKYSTSDDMVKEILDDMKKDVKDQVSVKINDTIDEAIGRKKIPDYTVDDLKITDDDVQILKSHYDKSRELDSAILQNRKANTRYENKIDDIVGKIQLEMNKLDEFRKAEKDRVFYVLSQNPPENTIQDDGESIGLLGQNTPEEGEDWEDTGIFSDDYSSETDYLWFDDIEIEDTESNGDMAINFDLNDRILGNWSGTSVNTDITILDEFTESEKQALRRYVGVSSDMYYTITKVGDKYFLKSGNYEIEIVINGNAVYYTIVVDVEAASGKSICEYAGIINDNGTKMIIDGLISSLPFDVSGKTYYLDISLKIEMDKI
jgi:hypothetical protein